jgi:hypothetical protein
MSYNLDIKISLTAKSIYLSPLILLHLQEYLFSVSEIIMNENITMLVYSDLMHHDNFLLVTSKSRLQKMFTEIQTFIIINYN